MQSPGRINEMETGENDAFEKRDRNIGQHSISLERQSCLLSLIRPILILEIQELYFFLLLYKKNSELSFGENNPDFFIKIWTFWNLKNGVKAVSKHFSRLWNG